MDSGSRRGAKGVVLAIAILAAPSWAHAQVLDAVSVKRAAAGQTGGLFTVEPGGRIVLRNLTVNALIGLAYSTDMSQLLPDQITSGPSWIHTDRFDIVGKTARSTSDDATTSREVLRSALHEVLRDRFKLQTHTESRELSTYALVLARDDRMIGPHLMNAPADCTTPAARSARTPACTTRLTDDSIHVRGLPFANFVVMLQEAVGRETIINETGLSGLFDIDLQWTPAVTSGDAANTSPASVGASIFTAVQEQLGLKLEVRKVPRDVLVVDHIERPAED
jgi:uncharacterized protein (TIGR03435 family)